MAELRLAESMLPETGSTLPAGAKYSSAEIRLLNQPFALARGFAPVIRFPPEHFMHSDYNLLIINGIGWDRLGGKRITHTRKVGKPLRVFKLFLLGS